MHILVGDCLDCSDSLRVVFCSVDELWDRVDSDEVLGPGVGLGSNSCCDNSVLDGTDGSDVFEHSLPKHIPRFEKPRLDSKFQFILGSGVVITGIMPIARVVKVS